MVPLVVGSHAPALWDVTKGCSPCTAPRVPPVPPQKTSETLTQNHQTAKGLKKEAAHLPRGRITFTIPFFAARNIPQ